MATKQNNNSIARKNENALITPRRRTKENRVLEKKHEEFDAENGDSSLRQEIAWLKEVVADKDETIDDLDQERDELYKEIYKLRLELAKAWNITLPTDAEKVREVSRLTSQTPETAKEKKPYSAAVKTSLNQILVETTSHAKNEANLMTSSSIESTDSGLGKHSLTQLIDDRLNLMIEAKLGIKPISNQGQNVSFTPEYTNLDTDRELNIIIHGLKEGEINDTQLVNDIFAATTTQHEPTFINRLGPKKDGKTRPLMLRMKNKEEKEKFMSKLWMLKNVRTRFKKMSITNDYTLEERNMIKKCVEEAKRRNTSEMSEYQWKVRGTPRSGLKLVKIISQA